jgi:thioester reductase-like protein
VKLFILFFESIGVRNILLFSSSCRQKTLHYVSTLSVFVSSNISGGRMKEDSFDDIRILYGGYAQSKWVSILSSIIVLKSDYNR